VITLGWFAISGRGASTTFDVGSGAFAVACCVGGADGALVGLADGETLSLPVFSWACAVKATKHITPKKMKLIRISSRMKQRAIEARNVV
jgi:hypothetical protein